MYDCGVKPADLYHPSTLAVVTPSGSVCCWQKLATSEAGRMEVAAGIDLSFGVEHTNCTCLFLPQSPRCCNRIAGMQPANPLAN